MLVGLSVTAALGLLMIGTLNLISVYFAVLFVGLGVDFGIQYSVRYRAERHEVDSLREALVHAGRRAGAPLTLAALATAAGFLSFLPTEYRGLSELGWIAGFGMLIAFFTSITLLPALLYRLKPRSEPYPLGYAFLAPVDSFLERHRIAILIVTGLVILGASPLLLWLRFDFNPMNLRNTKVESVATYLWLEKDQQGGASDIQALEPTLGGGRRGCRQAARASPGRARSDAVNVHPGPAKGQAAADRGGGEDAPSRALSRVASPRRPRMRKMSKPSTRRSKRSTVSLPTPPAQAPRRQSASPPT